MHLAVQVHRSAGSLEISVRIAVEGDPAAGERDRPGDHGRGPDLHVPAGDARVAGDHGVELHVATRRVKIVADAAADRDLATRGDQVALHFARDRNLSGGEERITRDRIGEVHHAANADIVVAELAGDAVFLVAVDADRAAADGRQAERRERHGRNEPGHRCLLRAPSHLAVEPEGLAGHRGRVYGTGRPRREPMRRDECVMRSATGKGRGRNGHGPATGAEAGLRSPIPAPARPASSGSSRRPPVSRRRPGIRAFPCRPP